MKRLMAVLLAMLLGCVLVILDLSVGDSGSDVERMQQLLEDMAYAHGQNGRFRQADAQGLRDFQAEYGLLQTGHFDIVTRILLEKVHAGRADEVFRMFHTKCSWEIDESADQLKFRNVLSWTGPNNDYSQITMAYYSEDAQGNRIAPTEGDYYRQTSEIVLTGLCVTDWVVFDDADRISKVYAAIHSVNGLGGDALHFVEYHVRQE